MAGPGDRPAKRRADSPLGAARAIVAIVFWFASSCRGEIVSHPFEGITLITRTETAPRPLSMHVALIDLRAPGIRFKLSPRAGTRETFRQTTIDFLAQEHAQLAINAHFYLPFTTPDTNANLVGFAVSEGIVVSPFEPQPITNEFSTQSFAILPFAPALNIDPDNHASIVHRDPVDPENRRVLEPVVLWTAVSGSARIVAGGAKTLPTYTGPPDGLIPSTVYSDSYSWYNALRARTAIGIRADKRTLVLFTVDETGGTLGMTVGEMADVLIRDYQVVDALNLDGDGSTSMAIADPVARLVNVPSDGVRGRAVGSSLAVFARPLVVPALRLRVDPSGDGSVIASWPAANLGWEFQRSMALIGAAWYKVEAEPVRGGDWLEVVVPAGEAPGFYRLAR